MLGKLKQQRRIAVRYDKTLLSFESFLNLAAMRRRLKSFPREPETSFRMKHHQSVCSILAEAA